MRKLLVFSFFLFSVLPAIAQSNKELYDERIISYSVYKVLTKYSAVTPEQRAGIIKTACASGELSGDDCYKNTLRHKY